MSYFNQASDFSIDNAAFVNFEGGATSRRTAIYVPMDITNVFKVTNQIHVSQENKPDLRHLLQFVARGASHDSKDQYESPKCAPETRTQLLSDIHEWVKVPDKVTGITLLHGPAGSGKSCIARSVCEKAASEKLLGGSFFFWRSASSRNNESLLITTLAYQLAERNETLCIHILSALADNPRIIEMPLESQFRTLIFDPCNKIPRDQLPFRVIVIDGLDECMGEETQIHILQVLAKAVRYEGFPIGFFITSRPELHLQEALETKQITFATNIISLSRVPGVSQDIQTVLESGFLSILNNPRLKRSMKSVARPWPTPEMIDKLVRRSSGQFIYAATVLKFVSSPNCNPAAQLEIILGIRDSKGSSPFADLDLLYNQIMSGVSDPELTLKVLRHVLAIKDLGRRMTRMKNRDLRFSPDITKAVLYNQNRLLLIVEQLLDLPDGTAYLSLNQLHSLISLNVGSESTRRRLEIDFYHKSFQDFLLDKKRSNNFNVKLNHAHHDLAISCLDFMGRQKYETIHQHVAWLYSCFQWNVHVGFGNSLKSVRIVKIETYDFTLRRFFDSSSGYFSILNDALRILGLLDQSWSSAVAENAINNMLTYGTLSDEDLMHALNDARSSIFLKWEPKCNEYKDFNILRSFDSRYAYPLWRRFLQTYKNDSLVKQLLLLRESNICFPKKLSDIEVCKILEGMGLIREESDRSPVLSLLSDISSLLNHNYRFGSSPINTFLKNADYSGSLYCGPEDIAQFYVGVLSFSETWRENLSRFFSCWKVEGCIVPATGAIVGNLNSLALEYYENVKLAKKLHSSLEQHLMDCLRNLLQPPQEEVIKAWVCTFDRACSMFPDHFPLGRSRRSELAEFMLTMDTLLI